MELSEFFKLRTTFEARARARREERLNHGDDTNWQAQVLEEMVIDSLQRVDALTEEVNKLKALIGAE